MSSEEARLSQREFLMTKRDVARLALMFKRPPYVPWYCAFTVETEEKLKSYFGEDDLGKAVQNHLLFWGSSIPYLMVSLITPCCRTIFPLRGVHQMERGEAGDLSAAVDSEEEGSANQCVLPIPGTI